MSEQILVFKKDELPIGYSKVEVVKSFNELGKYGFEIECTHCNVKSYTPQLILMTGYIICPNCKERL